MDRCSLWSILFSQGWCLWAWLRPAYTKLASGARDKCRHAEGIQSLFGHIFWYIPPELYWSKQNHVIECGCGSKHKSRSVSSTKHNPGPSFVFHQASVVFHWEPLCPRHMKTKAPPHSSIIQTHELQNIDISLYSENVMDNDQAVHQKMFPQKPRFWVKM